MYAFEGGGNAGLRSGCPREGRRGSAGSSPAWDLGASARGKGNSEAEGSPYAGLRKKTKPSKIKPISRYQTKALRTHPSGDSKEVWTVFATAPAGESFAGADDA